MDRMDTIHALDLDDHQVFHQKINPIPEFELFSFVNQRQANLRSHVKTSFAQFVGEAGLVSTLQKPGSELRVNFQRRINNSAGNLIYAWRADSCWTGHSFLLVFTNTPVGSFPL